VLGIGSDETQSMIDGLGILWLSHCREHGEARHLFEGLKVIVPQGASENDAGANGWMNAALAKRELYQSDERSRLIGWLRSFVPE